MSLSSSRPTSSSHLKNDSTSSPSSTSSSSSSSSSSLPAGSEGAYCFLVEWFDQQASMVRKYHLFYFLLDDTIEMYDIKNRRTFLKRCSYPSIQLADIYIGATLTVYARQLKCVGYGDEYTRSQLDVVKGRTIALIKSDGISQIGRIIDTIYRNQFTIAKMKQVIFNVQQACHFYGDKQVTTRASELSRGPVLAMEIIGKGVQQQLKQIADSKTSAATPFRDIHLSSSDRSADMESSYLFDNSNLQTTATLASCTVAVIKPHAVVAGQAGKIIEAIQEQGYEISCLGLYHLDRAAAQEFLEVYHTIIPEYNAIVEHFTSGPSIAMEIRQGKAQLDKLDIVSAFREFVGPADPEIARHIRPNTLRAQFGLSKVKNALHCTDLPEDGILESEFFFSILQKSK